MKLFFPRALCSPFYDPKADDAVNYGGMGAVIGHEITHGFDDHGSKFDSNGNLKDWWSPEDLKNFKARATCVSDQFDAYVVDGDLHEYGGVRQSFRLQKRRADGARADLQNLVVESCPR